MHELKSVAETFLRPRFSDYCDRLLPRFNEVRHVVHDFLGVPSHCPWRFVFFVYNVVVTESDLVNFASGIADNRVVILWLLDVNFALLDSKEVDLFTGVDGQKIAISYGSALPRRGWVG